MLAESQTIPVGNAVPCPKVVVIGASAGGLEAVLSLVRELPGDFPAALFVVIHSGHGGPNMLPTLIGRQTHLRVVVPVSGERISPGHIYVAPRDCHLLIDDSTVRVTHGPPQHGFRPAVDPLFVTAAKCYGDSAAGIILSGALNDGTAGLLAIKRAGGIALVQRPDEATFASMPLSALKNVAVDAILPAGGMARYLTELFARDKEAPRGSDKGRGASKAREDVPFDRGMTEFVGGRLDATRADTRALQIRDLSERAGGSDDRPARRDQVPDHAGRVARRPKRRVARRRKPR
jgi:hypothetical protein